MKKQDLSENEYLRFAMFSDGICLSTNRDLEGDDLEELLDDELSAEKDLITMGSGIGAYIATNENLNREHAIAALVFAIKLGIRCADKEIAKGDMRVEKEDDTKIESQKKGKESFNRNDYR